MVICASCGTESPDTFRFCPNCSAPLSSEPAREERRLATVLFADVTGSTSLGERLDPERLRAVLSSYFSAMSSVVEAWGGTVEKFIGDAVMAVFGLPLVREDDAERALRASLDMLARLDELNAEFRDRHGVTLQIRIGVNTGEVLSPVGAVRDPDFVAGDAINVAARLEQAAEPGTVLAGPRTYLATRNAFRFDPPVSLELKGKANPLEARRLVEPLPEATRGVPGLRSPMVGRDRELESLVALLDEAIETRRPRLVTVFGPAGIGKSRLALEFVGLAEARPRPTTVLRGRCLAAGQGITYWALGEILRQAARISLGEPSDVAAAKLARMVGHTLTDEVEQTTNALAVTAGIHLPNSPLDRLQPKAVADELARAWPRFVSALASKGPIILVVEDLHWAGAPMLDMLERLLARTEGPLLLVASARPEFGQQHPEFAAGREDSSSISLRPLTDQQGAELVENLLSQADFPPALEQEILSKAEGNPYFLEEIIRRLIDEGALIRDGDAWRATPRAATVALPDTVHGLLAARIDALPPEEKRALQEASVLGRTFWQEPVATALHADVDDALLSLERRGLVFARHTSSIAGQVEFGFKHALVRDVAYAALPKARRARAHAEQAQWLERLAGDRTEEFGELLAHHYATAVDDPDADLAWGEDPDEHERIRARAHQTLMQAGDANRRRYALARAVELHEQAERLAATDDELALALEALGDDHVVAFHGDAAFAAFTRALEPVRRSSGAGAPATRARLCLKAARIATKVGPFRRLPDPAMVDALIQEGLASEENEESRGWLLAVQGSMGVLWRRATGQDSMPPEERFRLLEQAWDMGERLHAGRLVLGAAEGISDLCSLMGWYDRDLELAGRLLASTEHTEDPSLRAEGLFWAALVYMDTGADFEKAFDLATRSHELAERLTPHELMHATHVQMSSLFCLGRWDEIEPLLAAHVAAYHQEEEDILCSALGGGLLVGAMWLAERGRTAEAEKLASMLPVTKERVSDRVEGRLARLMVSLGRPEAARELADRRVANPFRYPNHESALATVEALTALRDWGALQRFLPEAREQVGGFPILGAACDRAEAIMLAAQDRPEDAHDKLQEAMAGFERLRMPFEVARTKELSGDEPDLREALETYVRLGATPHEERIRAALSSLA
jgi:class 3 adenylate cyclase/tetratricopeptide (TPR) repeat protein